MGKFGSLLHRMKKSVADLINFLVLASVLRWLIQWREESLVNYSMKVLMQHRQRYDSKEIMSIQEQRKGKWCILSKWLSNLWSNFPKKRHLNIQKGMKVFIILFP